jgi:threonine dehydratase
MSLLTANAIAEMETLIRPHIRKTPVITVSGSEFGHSDFALTFKLECCQHAGSFKVRGAFANLLSRPVPAAGVVAASGGNHGAAVAFAAQKLGHRAKIFVPEVSSQAKIERIRAYGADLVVTGKSYADALRASQAWAETSGALQIHAFDQVETLLGQGTIALEFQRQEPHLDTILVAVGGGGLIGGIALWFARQMEQAKISIVGVEPEQAPTLSHALRTGHPVDAPAGGIAADSLAPRRIGELVFPLVDKHVRVVLVSDDAIRKAQKQLWDSVRVVTEPGGAAAFAALLSRRYVPQPGERVGIVISGGNTTAVDFEKP